MVTTHRTRLIDALIFPHVLIGQNKMKEYEHLQLIPCFYCSCGRLLNWCEFYHTAQITGYLLKFGFEILKEIWKNELFILKCCNCFKGSEIIGVAEWYNNEMME